MQQDKNVFWERAPRDVSDFAGCKPIESEIYGVQIVTDFERNGSQNGQLVLRYKAKMSWDPPWKCSGDPLTVKLSSTSVDAILKGMAARHLGELVGRRVLVYDGLQSHGGYYRGLSKHD